MLYSRFFLVLLVSPSVLNLSTPAIPVSPCFLLCISTKELLVRSWAQTWEHRFLPPCQPPLSFLKIHNLLVLRKSSVWLFSILRRWQQNVNGLSFKFVFNLVFLGVWYVGSGGSDVCIQMCRNEEMPCSLEHCGIKRGQICAPLWYSLCCCCWLQNTKAFFLCVVVQWSKGGQLFLLVMWFLDIYINAAGCRWLAFSFSLFQRFLQCKLLLKHDTENQHV